MPSRHTTATMKLFKWKLLRSKVPSYIKRHLDAKTLESLAPKGRFKRIRMFLEQQLQRELDFPLIPVAVHAADPSSGMAAVDGNRRCRGRIHPGLTAHAIRATGERDACIRVSEVGRIEQVEHFRSELRTDLLAYWKFLEEREIKPSLRRTKELVSILVGNRSRRWLDEIIVVKPMIDRRIVNSAAAGLIHARKAKNAAGLPRAGNVQAPAFRDRTSNTVKRLSKRYLIVRRPMEVICNIVASIAPVRRHAPHLFAHRRLIGAGAER